MPIPVSHLSNRLTCSIIVWSPPRSPHGITSRSHFYLSGHTSVVPPLVDTTTIAITINYHHTVNRYTRITQESNLPSFYEGPMHKGGTKYTVFFNIVVWQERCEWHGETFGFEWRHEGRGEFARWKMQGASEMQGTNNWTAGFPVYAGRSVTWIE